MNEVSSPLPARHAFTVRLACILLVAATLASYANTLLAPFEFDDLPSILDNPTIRQWWPLSVPLSPPHGWGFTVEGRPLLNLTLALNYAVSGTAVWSYHAVNLAIHVFAGLTLFGLLRRTLRAPVFRGRFADQATAAAFLGALVWTLHPIQTESVTYTIQRAESLAGLCLLLTLYGCARAADSAGPKRWLWSALAAVASLLGMATKETMVVAPVLALLYDRTFVAGSFRGVWRARRGLHAALAATWLLLVWLVLGAGNRGGTFDLTHPTAWSHYALTQFVAVVHYLRLVVWPHPLVIDHTTFWIDAPSSILLPIAVVTTLVVGTAIALWRWPVGGFLGFWFLGLLAPTSLAPGTIQMIVEHRMYLPLAAVAGIASYFALKLPAWGQIVVALLIGGVLGSLTLARNNDYRSEVALWTQTVASCPENPRAQDNLGKALFLTGDVHGAVVHYRESLHLDSAQADAHFNLALALSQLGQSADAYDQYVEALRLNPRLAQAEINLGLALAQQGRDRDAMSHFARAVQLRPEAEEARCNLAAQLDRVGRSAEAVTQAAAALRLRPDYAEAECNLGIALTHCNRTPEGIAHLRRAVRLKPTAAAFHYALGVALASTGAEAESLHEYTLTLRLDPNHAEAHLNLGVALARSGNPSGAVPHLARVVDLRPDWPSAYANYGIVLALVGRTAEAVAQYEHAILFQPAYPQAHYNLGNALLTLGRVEEARTHFEAALQLDPRFDAARQMLERIGAAPR